MNTWKQVETMLKGWQNQGLSKEEIIVNLANACIGWAYVFGARGEQCTPANRRRFYNSKGKPTIKSKCKNFNGSGSAGCSGCKWYPGGVTLFYDCRGFTYWILLMAAEIKIAGVGATSQWNDDDNWDLKGTIEQMPKDKICCVFKYNPDTKKMEHTLLYDGKGHYIHCSGEVKKCNVSQYKATDFAVPKGLYKDVKPEPPEPIPEGYAKVTGKRVALRKDPSKKADIIMRIDTGEQVKLETPPPSEWDYVSYKNKQGYMMKEFLEEG